MDDERILAAVDKIAICQIKSEAAATGESGIASDYVSAAAGAQGGKRTPPPRTKPALVGVSKVMLPDGTNGRLIVCVMGEAGLPLKTIVPSKPKLFPANVNAPAKKTAKLKNPACNYCFNFKQVHSAFHAGETRKMWGELVRYKKRNF